MDLKVLFMQEQGDVITTGGTPPQETSEGNETPPAVTAPQKPQEPVDPKPTGEGEPEVKTLTVDEVNVIFDKRFAKITAKHEETVAEIQKQLEEEKAKAKAAAKERDAILRRNKVKELGVDDEFIDYVLATVTDDAELEEFIKSRPRFLKANYQNVQSNPSYQGGAPTKSVEIVDTKDSGSYVQARIQENQK